MNFTSKQQKDLRNMGRILNLSYREVKEAVTFWLEDGVCTWSEEQGFIITEASSREFTARTLKKMKREVK